MLKKNINLLLFFIIGGLTEPNAKSWADTLFSDSTVYLYKKEDIDTSFLRLVSILKKRDLLKKANPNEKIDPSSTRKDGIPDQRLILFAENSKYRLLAFEQGGRAHNAQVIVFHGHIFRKSISLPGIPKDKISLKNMLVGIHLNK